MASETKIEWADSTLNLQMGCDGCELWNEKSGVRKCYAGQITERYGGKPGWPDSFTRPKLFLERLNQLLKWPDLTGKPRKDKPWLNGYPRMVFLDDMGDTFTESLPLDWLARPWTFCPKGHAAPIVQYLPEEKLCICTKCIVKWEAEYPLDLMSRTPHVYMLLTKRANRMRQFSEQHPFPKNFWLFTSVTDKSTMGRVGDLLQVRGGSILGVSYEPALGPVDFETGRGYLTGQAHDNAPYVGRKVELIIFGGESGPGARPCDIRWARDTVRQCKAANVKCFVKQLGTRPYDTDFRRALKTDKVVSVAASKVPWLQGFTIVHTPDGNTQKIRHLKLRDKKGGDLSEWPEDLRVRELPEASR